MITGFNTDVQHDGVTYHVQTEDKGLDTPLILSLVYVGGAIIASKRTPYADLISRGFDEQTLTERLQRQHKLICAAIKAGRVDDLKRMSGQGGGSAQPEFEEAANLSATGRKAGGQKRKKAEAPAPPEVPADTTAETPAPPAEVAAPPAEVAAPPAEIVEPPGDAPALPAEASAPLPQAPAPPPEVVVTPPRAVVTPPKVAATPTRVAAPPPKVVAPPVEVPATRTSEPAPARAEASEPAALKNAPGEPDIVLLTTLAEEISSLDYYRFDPPRKTRPEAEPAGRYVPAEETAEPLPVEPIIEAVILEESEDFSDEIYLSLLDDEGEFRAGQLVTIKIYVGRGAYGQRPVGGASLTVKVLGTAFRPLIITSATDEHGVGVVRALLPRFNSGRAAIIIRAVAGESSAEMRRIIHQ